MSMTESEAIKEIRKKACNDRCTEIHCNDSCMYGKGKCPFEMAISALEEIQQYRAIGTVSEFRELKEKATAKPIKGKRFKEAICPCCLTELYETYWAFGGVHYCVNCGTAIDWSEGKE